MEQERRSPAGREEHDDIQWAPTKRRSAIASPSRSYHNGEWPPPYARPSRPGGSGASSLPRSGNAGTSYPPRPDVVPTRMPRTLRRLAIVLICLVVVATLVGLVVESIYLLQLQPVHALAPKAFTML